MGNNPKVVFLVDSKALRESSFTQKQLAFLLTRRCGNDDSNDTNRRNNSDNKIPATTSCRCCAILEPTMWWNAMTYSSWNRAWHESVTKTLVSVVAQRGEEEKEKGGDKTSA